MTTSRSGLMGKEGDGDEGRVYAGTEQDRGDLRALVFIVASGAVSPESVQGDECDLFD